jgi:hypothetical protein
VLLLFHLAALFQCRKIGHEYYLERDLQENCNSRQHISYVYGLAVPSLLLYGLGMPLGSFLILNRAFRRGKLKTNKYRFRLGLLYSGYRDDRWWWEVVIAARKVVIISLAAFGFNESIQVSYIDWCISICYL